MFEKWFRWSWCRCCVWERGDLQWQSSSGGALTVWASEASLQRQALKQSHNWLEQPGGIITRMTVLLRETRPPQTHKPSRGVDYNRSKSFILSSSGSAKTLCRILPSFLLGLFLVAPQTLPFSSWRLNYARDSFSCFCTGWIPSFMVVFSLPTKNPFIGAGAHLPESLMSPVCLEFERKLRLRHIKTRTGNSTPYCEMTLSPPAPPPPLDYKIRLRKWR